MKEKNIKKYKKTGLRNGQALEEYKKQVAERLSRLTPILQKIAMGDFSENVAIPEKEDEFTELLVNLNLMVEDFRSFVGLEEYKKQVAERLSRLTPILQKIAMGDFSENIVVPEKEEEFTELLASLNLMIDDLKELTEAQKRAKEEVEQKVKERTKELRGRTEELEDSKRALVNILEDVRVAQQGAEEEKNKTLSIITNFTDGLLFFDKENRLSLVNPKAENIFDVKSRDVIGRTIMELKTFPTLRSLTELVGEEIKGVFRKEIKFGEKLILEVDSVLVMRGEENLGSLVILHDVSREKMIERMKTEFVSLAAHQLRTPISAIKWTLRMLLDGDLGEITEDQRNFIEKTYLSNERMISLINDLLDITRIEEGRYLYRPTLAGLEDITQFVLNSYKEEFEKRKIKCIFLKPTKRLPAVKVDIEKIRLAIQNLIDNAMKYTPVAGEVTVSLKCGKKEIELSVKDTGVGVPKDQQNRVFTKFFRGVNVIRMETDGSGLGLYITKNIIEAHGGKIWFESEEGKGSTFYFSIPLKEEFEKFLKEL
jgi:PAS domain S-box-containing protein